MDELEKFEVTVYHSVYDMYISFSLCGVYGVYGVVVPLYHSAGVVPLYQITVYHSVYDMCISFCLCGVYGVYGGVVPLEPGQSHPRMARELLVSTNTQLAQLAPRSRMGDAADTPR